MARFTLRPAQGYDPQAQQAVGLWAAQLDLQLDTLIPYLENLEVRELEWQRTPRRNTIGMLLAHLAVTEVYWLQVGAAEITDESEGEEIVQEILGIQMTDDGIPLTESGGHPPSLAGWSLQRYADLLTRAREATHRTLRRWRDDELDTLFEVDDHQISRSWVLYHLLQHFAGHAGQIRSIKRQLPH